MKGLLWMTLALMVWLAGCGAVNQPAYQYRPPASEDPLGLTNDPAMEKWYTQPYINPYIQ